MTKANECTCPSGDGSLRHPCPAHPASVELAGVAANLTFINGRPAMCGCQVEYSSGGGEYSDVIYVTLCAKHSGSAILDLVATNRIALTPEYEGQWHADLYLDREIPLAKAEGATPAEAVLALMSAERIDPEQESVEQAGGDERAAFFKHLIGRHPAHETEIVRVVEHNHAAWKAWQARAALAQPSPVSEALIYACKNLAQITSSDGSGHADIALAVLRMAGVGDDERERLVNEWKAARAWKPSPAQVKQAEAERPEVVGVRYEDGTILSAEDCGTALEVCAKVQTPLMTVAQHERIVKAWIERWKAYIELSAKIAAQRDAALARVAELEKQEPVAWVEVIDRDYGPYNFHGKRLLPKGKHQLYAAPVAQAQHSVPEEFIGRLSEFLAQRGATGKALLRELRDMLAAATDKEVGHE
ncbi:hypothetical protein [Pseudomonas aeruginosa]|uniref:hypothetical protein n=2 Tax=Pseudomonas aeruginosa TaxID=287 RepID=UPI003C0B4AFD